MMRAEDVKLLIMLEGSRQYIVPLFQRPYVWKEEQWEALWEDLMGVYHSTNSREHFLGSMVTLPSEPTPAFSKFIIIDGQQRLATLMILLSVIRDLAREQNPTLAEEIGEKYLRNKFERDHLKYKLLPSHQDRRAFEAIIEGRVREVRIEGAQSESLMLKAWEWFREKLLDKDENGRDFDLNRLRNIIVSQLVLVSVTLDRKDNPYLIFETLNYRGTPLTQADLIRNFVFMGIDVSKQEDAYREKWLPIQEALGESLPEFFRHFLIMKKGEDIRTGYVFATFRDEYKNKTGREMLELLDELHTYARFYEKLLDPSKEENPSIRRSLDNLNLLKVTTAYPLLLKAYSLYSQKAIAADEFQNILRSVESFVIRRFAVALTTRPLSRIFSAVSASVAPDQVVASIQEELKKYDWPDDDTFSQALKTNPLYRWGPQICKYILRALEESYGHKEEVVYEGLQVEHIMPQTLSQEWKRALGSNYEDIHKTYLDTLGNLTLSGYNQELWNRPFPEKRKTYAGSHLELTRRLADFTEWNEETIRRRAEELATRALRIWVR
jgi:uncharacterized protein with ParB-like and HNH nuclease domain